MRIESHAIHVVHFGHLVHFVHERAGVGFATALHVGVEKKIHGMELVAFAAHAHGRHFARRGNRGEVGIDVVLPQADAGEDVRWHMQRVRSGGRDLRITARGGNAELRQLRLVVAVDQVMRDSGMIGLGGEKFFENGGRLLAIGERRVMVRLRGKQRERVEDSGFVIVWEGLVDLLHRVGIGLGAGVLVHFVRVGVKSLDCGDIKPFARGGVLGQLFSGIGFAQATCDDLGIRRVPQLMPDAHGNSPMRHGAVGIVFGDVEEFLFRFFVPEGVQQRHAALERLLLRCRARNGEVDCSELRLVQGFVVVVFFVVSDKSCSWRRSRTAESRRQTSGDQLS